MAKKKATLSATSHMPGDAEAQENIVQAASSRLKAALEEKGVDITEFLKDEFGISRTTSTQRFRTNKNRSVTFYEVELSYEEVKEKTYVIGEINGREQETLNDQRTSDIESIDSFQFYHLIGVIEQDGRIQILDGSRRRYKYLSCKPDYKLRVLVTEETLSPEEAEDFATKMQTAKPKTIRDHGFKLRAALQANPGASYQELGEPFGWNKMDVSRRLKAADIPASVISYFPMVISVRQFDEIHKLVFKAFKGDVERVVALLKEAIEARKKHAVKKSSGDEELDTATLITYLKANAENEKKPIKPQKYSLGSSIDLKGGKADKEISSSGQVAFKFKGVPDETIEAIEKHIVDILSSNQQV